MADRDKYGNYVNDKGVTIKVNTDKNGKEHISFYGGDVDKPHDAVHIDIDYNKEKWSSTTHNSDKSDTNKSNGGCYLTTACMKHFQDKFDDNCYELTILRWFRDNFISKEDIKHYYETAPIIVKAINEKEKNELIYNYIYENVIKYCVTQIENKNYDKAYSRYKNSILCFEEQFAKPLLEQKFTRILKKYKD